MKSPFTGKKMSLKYELRKVEFRKEEFEIAYHYYLCEDSEEQFTDTRLDEYNIQLLHNQYRAKHNIPLSEEIRRIREKYGLSAAKMSEILGLGANTYRQYEAGEVPNFSNARLLNSAANPEIFYTIAKDSWETEDQKDKEKVLKKIESIKDQQEQNDFHRTLWLYFLGTMKAEIETGYRLPNIEKFTAMVQYFASHCQPFKTKMNKLLFYSDFLMFKETGRSISGIRYAAINYGPVPNNFQSIYEYLSNNNSIDIQYLHYKSGSTGEKINMPVKVKMNIDLLSEHELDVLKRVLNKFLKSNTNQIVEYSHLEKAWTDHAQSKSIISYKYAFDLNSL